MKSKIRTNKLLKGRLTKEEDATLLLSQLHSTREYYLLGLVNEEQLGRLKSKIKFAILELAR